MKAENNISVRAWILFSVLALVGLAIIAKVFVIQTTKSELWDKKGTQLDRKVMTINPTRGRILSSDGSILAITVPRYALYWDAKCEGMKKVDFDSNIGMIVQEIHKMFPEKSETELQAKFDLASKKGSRYMKIIEEMDYDQKNKLRALPFIKRGQYKSGFIFAESTIRQKFFGELASRTIGSTTTDSLKGTVGLELSFDKELAGVEGKQVKVKIPGGEWKPLSANYIKEPKEGFDLISTIDIHLQDLVQTSLETSLHENEGEWGCAILMEVKTGEIKGISNLTRNSDGTYSEYLNHAIHSCSDPGSTFKIPAIMCALEDRLISIGDSVETSKGYKRVYQKDIRDTEDHGTGTVADIIKWSSNVGMSNIIDRCYGKDKQKFLDRLNAFHLGESLGIELIGETKPKLYQSINEDLWSGLSHHQMAMGYEVGQTPLQILTFYNAIANNGVMVKPIFAKELRQNNKVIKKFEPIVIDKKLCSKQTLVDVQKMLRMVCNEDQGTAYGTFKNKPYDVAGKTGTAWVYDDKTSQYIIGDYRGSFVGYFPEENPKYSCIVVINKPTVGAYYGNTVAAPVFRDIADVIFASEANTMAKKVPGADPENRITPVSLNGSTEDLLTLYAEYKIPYNIKDKDAWSSATTSKKSVEVNAIKFAELVVPDVKGMSITDAIFILENMGLDVQIEGNGIIKEQIPDKGAPIKNHNSIKLVLK